MKIWPPEFGPYLIAHHTANAKRLRTHAIKTAIHRACGQIRRMIGSAPTIESKQTMSNTGPPVGLCHSKTLIVDASLTVPEVSPLFGSFHDMPPVLQTANMIVLMEATCMEALKPYLAAHQRTVGIHLDVGHAAATPAGMKVTAKVELVAVKGRRLQFKVECHDEVEPIGSGLHDRAIVDVRKFAARLDAKSRKSHGQLQD